MRTLLRCAALAAVLSCAPPVLTAPTADLGPAPEVEFVVPRMVAGLRFSDRVTLKTAAEGTQIRFSDAKGLVVDAFVYPGPDLGEECPMACARDLLKAEHEGFVGAFTEMKARGMVKEVRLEATRALWPPAGSLWRLGHHLQLSIVRDSVPERSDWYVFYLRDRRLKVRATYVEDEARVAKVRTFVDSVFTAFTSGPVLADLPSPSTDSLLALLAGTWDWETSDTVCARLAYTMSVTPDRREVVLRYVNETDSTGAPEAVRYTIVEAGSQILAWASHTIRLNMHGEDRKTEAGALVVWDLIFDTRDRYVWHRTDWERGATTRGIVRCGD